MLLLHMGRVHLVFLIKKLIHFKQLL